MLVSFFYGRLIKHGVCKRGTYAVTLETMKVLEAEKSTELKKMHKHHDQSHNAHQIMNVGSKGHVT